MAHIDIEIDENNRLTVRIITERLVLESITPLHIDDYIRLFGKRENMATFADGEPRSAEKTAQSAQEWIKRWLNNDPFSAFTITKNDTDEFVGYASLGYGEAGCGELAYVLEKDKWRKGYGSESVTTIVKEYAPELYRKNYKVGKNDFIRVTASTRYDNVASREILKKSGLKYDKEDVYYGNRRLFFFADVKDLIQAQDKQSPHPNESQERSSNKNLNK